MSIVKGSERTLISENRTKSEKHNVALTINCYAPAGVVHSGSMGRPSKSMRHTRFFETTKDHEILHQYSINFARRVLDYRKCRRLTQAALSKKVGIPQTVLSNFESGWANPSLANLLKLAKFFNVSVNDLISPPPKIYPKSQPFDY